MKWISVKDKLPVKSHVEVLITDGIKIGIGHLGNNKFTWFDHFQYGDYCNIPHKDVTHWMPLPEVPK